jgi:tetraprenyl-beta-curcumene synthase
VFPEARREIRGWRARAAQIPDPTLRRLALAAHRAKRGNLEGSVAFATFSQPAARRAAIRAAVSYQTLFDYLDYLSEEPSANPIANGRRLNSALLSAVVPNRPPLDHYELREGGGADGGYLSGLIEACRLALSELPAFNAIAEPARAASARIADYQSLNHGDGDGRHEGFERWARALNRDSPQLRWWETGAAAGSTLDLLALFAAATDSRLEQTAARTLAAAYFPWVGALHSLLDSLADWVEDEASGERGLIAYYRSAEEAAERLDTIAVQATRHAAALPGGETHVLIVAAMTSFYLCDISRSSSLYARLAVPALLRSKRQLLLPTMAILQGRRVAGQITSRLDARLSASRRPPFLRKRPSLRACWQKICLPASALGARHRRVAAPHEAPHAPDGPMRPVICVSPVRSARLGPRALLRAIFCCEDAPRPGATVRRRFDRFLESQVFDFPLV